ncbi:MAG: magnesium transporter [Gammaproteobacteria bacterium]|nr:MAG: magnesium transporter [Gammaproteobacteria bacterium]RKZ43096.1 MAG: magnesium transporter [Gammaproteobacteria bacterium]RKZ72745.1 MAG: magnesium transporter [Gammaproteobacteria bacterium]
MTTPIDLEKDSEAAINAQVEKLHPSEIADILESLPQKQRDKLWQCVDQEKVLAHLSDGVRGELMQDMPPTEVAEAIQSMDTDDAVDVLQDLPDESVEKVLQAIDVQEYRRLRQVLFYPENTAGGLMNVDVLIVRTEMTLKQVLHYLRRLDKLPEKTDILMVIDKDNYYQGVLLITDLLTHALKLTVEKVMKTEMEAIPAHLSAHEVALLFEQRDLLSAPVTDEQGILVGRITIDDVVDVIRAEADHNLMSQAGLDKEDDMFAPILTTTRDRALWLGINLITAFLAAYVIGLFETTLDKVVALAVLMPIVASMGGIAGTQTLTIVIRGMAVGQITDTNTPFLLRKELAVSLLNGMMWALVVALIAILWFGSLKLGLILGSALIINLFCAALAGVLIPLLLRRLSIDPALAGGVVLTTVTDIIGFSAFLGLATVFLLHNV